MSITTLECDGRAVSLFIPADRASDSPLLLAHDGQNCFDGVRSFSGHGWQLDQAAASAAKASGTKTPIIVAPWNTADRRTMEYAPEDLIRSRADWLASFRAMHGDESEPAGNAYLDWCVDRLLPWAADYAGLALARERTAVLGSSMGGLISLAALARRPEAFECALCVSTHWTGGGPEFTCACIAMLPAPGRHRLWFDHGDRGLDAGYGPLQAIANRELNERGWENSYRFTAYPGADHSEPDWAARADQVLSFWLSGVRT